MTPFFIIGSQRSGTTLLRLILNANSKIAIPEEGTFWMPLMRLLRGDWQRPVSRKLLTKCIEYIRENDQFRSWRMDPVNVFNKLLLRHNEITLRELMEALYMEYARINNKPFWGDKTPSFFRKIKELSEIFPEAKFINIVRDGRDVYLSMRTREPGRNNIAVAALEWKYKVQTARRQLSNLSPDRWMEVRYEDILKNPSQKISEICDFLGISHEEAMLDFYKSSHRFIGEHHSGLIFKPITTDNIGKWKDEMTNSDNRIFESIAHGCLENLGYEFVNKGRLNGLDTAISFGFLCIGLPRRIFQVIYTALMLQISLLLGLRTSAAGGRRNIEG